MFHGSLVALVTPMLENGAVDYLALARLVDWHIQEGTDGLVILGSTGEAATIEDDEREQIVSKVIKQVNDRLPVIVGTGSNSTQHAIRLTQQAMSLGADAALLVVPYYNKPTQEGLYQHFKAIALAVPIPQIVYNVPARTACDILPETILRLADFSNIVGVKEATGDIARVKQLQGCNMDLLSGDDKTALDFMLVGGRGVISVVANLVPKWVHDLTSAALAADQEKAQQYNHQLQSLLNVLNLETNPIAVKWALVEMGLISTGIRLPLTPFREQFRGELRKILTEWNLLSSHPK